MHVWMYRGDEAGDFGFGISVGGIIGQGIAGDPGNRVRSGFLLLLLTLSLVLSLPGILHVKCSRP